MISNFVRFLHARFTDLNCLLEWMELLQKTVVIFPILNASGLEHLYTVLVCHCCSHASVYQEVTMSFFCLLQVQSRFWQAVSQTRSARKLLSWCHHFHPSLKDLGHPPQILKLTLDWWQTLGKSSDWETTLTSPWQLMVVLVASVMVTCEVNCRNCRCRQMLSQMR